MREGLLLAEDSPETIIRELESETLEGAFLKLSIRQEANYLPRNNLTNDRLPAICNETEHRKTTMKNTQKYKLHKEQFKVLLRKNILTIFRQPS